MENQILYNYFQAVDDTIPEQRTTYTLQLTKVTGGAILDPENSMAEVIMVASDFPHGLFEFGEPLEILTAESDKQVTVIISLLMIFSYFSLYLIFRHTLTKRICCCSV